MKLLDLATLKLDASYFPFKGNMEDLYINLDKSFKKMMEDEQTDYNPMVGSFNLCINATFSVEGAKVVKGDTGIIVENYDELFASGKCNVEELLALKRACEAEPKCCLTEDEDGVSCNVLEMTAVVLKAYDFRFDVDVDVLECADAVNRDMFDSIEKATDIQDYTSDKRYGDGWLNTEDIGVLMINGIKCSDGLISKELIEWVFDNMKTLINNYVATEVYAVAMNHDQAYCHMQESTKDKFEEVINESGFELCEKADSKFKWLLER